MFSSIAAFDIEVLRMIHQNRIVALDPLLYILSYSSSFISIGIVLAVLIAALKKKSAMLRKIFYKLLAVLIIAALTSLTIKSIFGRERPFKTYPDIQKLSEAGSSSFPSGHTLEAFAMAVAVSISFPRKKFIIPLFTWAALVAYSRMALGVHYPVDVLGGMLIGSFTGWLIPALFKTKPDSPS